MDLPPEIAKATPGVLGSLTATLFFRGSTPKRALFMFLAGAAMAQFAGEPVATFVHVSVAVGSYASGLFGLAVVAKVFELIESLDVAGIGRALLKRIGG